MDINTPKTPADVRIKVCDMLIFKNVKEVTNGDYFMFPAGRRIHQVYNIACNEIFYTNLLTKKSAKIRINKKPGQQLINVTHLFATDNTVCPF